MIRDVVTINTHAEKNKIKKDVSHKQQRKLVWLYPSQRNCLNLKPPSHQEDAVILKVYALRAKLQHT